MSKLDVELDIFDFETDKGEPITHIFIHDMRGEKPMLEFVPKDEVTKADLENVNLMAENSELRDLVADSLLTTVDYCKKYGGPKKGMNDMFFMSDWRAWHMEKRLNSVGIEVKTDARDGI